MPDPKRWPNNSNDARVKAMEAAQQSIVRLVDLIGALLENDMPAALRCVKRIHTLQTYIQSTLMGAKYGEAPEPLPKEDES